MDKEFHKHIVKNRADPTANSVRNPVPDYYGEKIKSVSEYRKWLRKQREYRRKATFFVGVDYEQSVAAMAQFFTRGA